MEDSVKPMSDEALELVAKRFAVLAEPMRLRLLQSLMDGEKNVNALVAESGGTQANVSRHLQTLARDGLLSRRREGLQVFYAVADKSIFNLCTLVCGSIREGLKKQSEAIG
ncbi:MAG: metalloregulator ArsR/SmtB family transcription factor [Opitutales bacterium]|jgi:ArsR family transcriptional regulator